MSHISLTYHIIWRTKRSQRTIAEEHEREFYAYIHGMCKNMKCTLYRVNSMPDHVHICVEVHPTMALSDFMKAIKQGTSNWMKAQRSWYPDFEGWGNGYAAFTYAVKDRTDVVAYIRNQKEHHKKCDFRVEYNRMLMEFGLNPENDRFLED